MRRPAARCTAALLLLVGAACSSTDLAPSVWPPPDFELTVEEMVVEGEKVQLLRRFSIDAEGLAVYATASRSREVPDTNIQLPVFDRLAVYRLVPTCVRGLARRLERLGIREIDAVPEAAGTGPGVVIVWRAFDQERVLTAQGRLRGQIADMLAVVAAHLPPGESFALPLERPVVPVLHGAPVPVLDPAGALEALTLVHDERGADSRTMLDAFTLACELGDRDAATRWLERWSAATAADRAPASAFPDGAPRLRPEQLVRALPDEPRALQDEPSEAPTVPGL